MPTNSSGTTANVVKDKIHVLSREGHTVYDTVTDSWTAEEEMPYPTYGFGSAVLNDKIYVIGWNQTQIYDTETQTWSLGATSPISVSHAAVCATTGVVAPKRIYVFGGYPKTWIEETNAAQVYDPETDTWTLGASMPSTRAGPVSAVVNYIIYVIGGGRGFFVYTAERANEQYTPFGYGLIEPVVSVLSPQNKTFGDNIPLTFTVDKPVSWIQYSLDGQDNLTVTENTTLTDLSNGLHNLTVYAKYTEGIIGASEIVYFSVDVPEPFPTASVATGITLAVLVSIGVLIYFEKRKH